MVKTDDGRFLLFYNSLGNIESANCAETGTTIWVKGSPHYTSETNPLTADFLAQEYDLSDRPDLAIPETML